MGHKRERNSQVQKGRVELSRGETENIQVMSVTVGKEPTETPGSTVVASGNRNFALRVNGR
jgi:hypothetical protein